MDNRTRKARLDFLRVPCPKWRSGFLIGVFGCFAMTLSAGLDEPLYYGVMPVFVLLAHYLDPFFDWRDARKEGKSA